MKSGGSEREAFLESQLYLVKRVWSRLRIGLPPQAAANLEEDLLSAGAMGLVQAYDKFSEREGAAFATFASHRIRGAMLDELRRQDFLSKQARHRLKEIQRCYRELEQKLGRPASDEEAASALKTGAEALRQELVELGPSTLVFLEGLTREEGRGGWKDFLADASGLSPEEQVSRAQVKASLADAVGRLPEQERTVLRLLVHEELGQMEIAEVLGVTPSRVSQIYSKAIIRLQAAMLPLFE